MNSIQLVVLAICVAFIGVSVYLGSKVKTLDDYYVAGRNTSVYMWTRDWLIASAQRMKDLGIRPELEAFNPTTVDEIFRYLKPSGAFPDRIGMTFVMGMDRVSQGAIAYSQKTVDMMIDMIPHGEDPIFTTMAIGAHQLEGTVYSLLKGGNVRVGFEDNIYYRKGELATSNAQLVERMVRIIHELNMEVATPEEAREMLSISKR